jgi:anti-anti-sigma regulatory factor
VSAAAVVALTADATLVVLDGRIGPAEVDEVRAALALAGDPPARRFIVDCTAATIDDPEALAALYDLAGIARARDGVVAVATGRESALRRVLEASGLDAAFTLYDRRSRALDDLDLPDPGPTR